MKNNIFKNASGFIFAAVMLLLMACGIPVRVCAEEAFIDVSGTLGNITWRYAQSTTHMFQYELVISGTGDIPTLDELGLEQYPWAEYEYKYLTVEEGVTSIPPNFCNSDTLAIGFPDSLKRISSGAFNGSIIVLMMSIYSMDCIFEENAFNTENIVSNYIIAYSYSTAQEFANDNGLKFISLGEKAIKTHTEDFLEYDIYREYAVVTGYTGEPESISIPSEVEGLPVVEIDDKAFSECTSLTSASIPDSVTKIGTGIFGGCTSLTSVIFPESMTSIKSGMFSGCTSITSMTIPDGVTAIDSYAFNDCTSLKRIVLPEGITAIDSYAFSGCTSLTEIDIPDSVEKIYEYAFSGSGLVSVELPENLVMVYEYAFSNCFNLTELILPENMKELNYKVILNVPDGVLELPDDLDIVIYGGAFNHSSDDDDDIVLPDYITSMYCDSFEGYTSITIGSKLRNFNVPELDANSVFDISLKEVHISEDNPYLCCENGVIYNKDKTEIIYVIPGYKFENGIMTIPTTVKKLPCAIVNYSIANFEVEEGNTEFSTVDGVLFDAENKTLIAYPHGKNDTIYLIPPETETIGKGSFYKAASQLKVINIPVTVKTIEQGAFWRSSFEYIIFRHSSTDEIDIAENFEGYYELTGYFRDTDTQYFAYEGSLIETLFPDHFKTMNTDISGSCGENLKWELNGIDLTISGTGKMTEFNKNEYPWSSTFYVNVKFNGDDIKISDQAFTEVDYIYTIDFSGVTEIGDYAFYCCKNLNKISGHEEVVMVGDSAFNGTCWIIDTIDNVYTKILGSVLVRYLGTSEIAEIPENVTSVTANAFQNNKCKTLFIPDNNIFFHSRAFSGTSVEHVRYKGMEEDITLDELREAASLCEEKTFIDSAGNNVTGLAVGKENGLASLANALSSSPFLESMYDEYCYDIIKRCSEGMSDKQLITVLYNYTNNNVKYGFVYAEDSNGEYKNGDISYELSTGLSHRPTGIVVLDRGVCSSYAELVNKYTSLIREQGLSSTLESVERYGLDHVWNAIGLDAGTENEKWYYMDLSNRTYLIGYENGILTSNPEMFAYDSDIQPNEDGTYTVTLTSGKVINIQSADAELVTVKGDVNGDGRVMIDDATAVLAIYAETAAGMETSGNTAAADIDGNGSVDITDATAILTYYAQYSAGMDSDWNEMVDVA